MKKRKVRKTKKSTRIVLVLFLFAILLIDVGIYLQATNFSLNDNKNGPTPKVYKEKKQPKEYSARMIMVGDALIHRKSIQ